MSNPWKRVAQAMVVLVALGFLAALVRGQWSELMGLQWHLSVGWAVVALLGLELTWAFEIDTWRAILASLGGDLRFRQAAPVWFVSNIVRYIPGNVWQFLGMAELAASEGVSRLVTLTSIVLHQVISTAAGLVLAAVYFGVVGEGVWFTRLRPLLFSVPVGLVLLQPRLLERVLNWVLVRVGRQPLRVTLTWAQVWMLLLRYLLVWLGMGLSFAALVRALMAVKADTLLYLVAAWAGAYVIGYLSLLTPSGIGVREGVMVLLLLAVMPEALATVVAITARLWMVVGELAGAAGALAAQPDRLRRLIHRSRDLT